MSHSTHQIQQYEERKPFTGDFGTPYQRSGYQSIPRNSTPLARPGSRNINMDPNESWTSNNGQSFMGQQSYMDNSTQFQASASAWSEERIQMLQARLRRQLGPEYVSQRQGPGGAGKLSYIEGWKVLNLANEIFGFNGWSSSIVSLKTDYIDENNGKVNCNVTAIVRVTLRDGVYHEDTGCGQGLNQSEKSRALDKAQKEAVTDATKRALRAFGNAMGNCMYDKEYTKEVLKIKVPPAKFNRDNLERRPEFTPAGASGPSTIPQQPNNQPKPAVPIFQPQPINPQVQEPPILAPGTPLRSINEPQDVFMDESFDAEFMDMGDESFLDQIEESNIQPEPRAINGHSNGTSHPQNAQAGPSRIPQQAEQPTYQHRHRPDVPNVVQPKQPVQQHSNGNMSRTKSQDGNQTGLVGSKPSSGNSTGSATISGGSGNISSEPPKPRPVGGFAAPKTGGGSANASAAAASARRQAMAMAMNARSISPSPPIRAESPKIPSGGIDHVAARATTKLKSEGVSLRLDENGLSEDGENVTMGGFTSARGMKRSSDHSRSVSPTKSNSGQRTSQNSIQGQMGYNRQANRTALAELKAGIEGGGIQEDWNAKRSRIG